MVAPTQEYPPLLDMELRTSIWICVILFVLLMESQCTGKQTLPSKNWGPQSKMYLQGKFGRRHEPETLENVYESEISNLFTIIKGFQKLRSVDTRSPKIFTSENLMIHYVD
ncbi:spexin prohormone 2-like [Engraulis encrasicolus]|uniref:spexin prohormone 2-like n=1 Tax=Engraulis encrasicolus TaxID=184585 RepID=UPI002FD53E4D